MLAPHKGSSQVVIVSSQGVRAFLPSAVCLVAQALLAARPAPAAIGQALGALPQRQELHAMALQHCRSSGTKRVRTRSARADVSAGCLMEDAMAVSPLEAQRAAAACNAGTLFRRCFT